MNRDKNIRNVAILAGTTRDWNRNLIRGILAYSNRHTPWNIWTRPNNGLFHALPEGWSGQGLIARISTPELADKIIESGLPVVNIGKVLVPGFPAPTLRSDDTISARMAVEHFAERNLTNLIVIGPLDRPSPAAYMRAFQTEATSQGYPCEIHSAHDLINGSPELKIWLKKIPKPSGILTMGHILGKRLLEYCRQEEISVPYDVAVLSSNYDALMCNTCYPALSGIICPTEQIGYKAAELLEQMMNGEAVSYDTIHFPPLGIENRMSSDTLAVDDPPLVKVIESIRKRAFEPIALKDILNEVPMARRTLDYKFKKTLGHSPAEEIRKLRINKARKMLAQTDLPMQFIAEACGYANYNYLTQVFKQNTGMTPSEYRKQFHR